MPRRRFVAVALAFATTVAAAAPAGSPDTSFAGDGAVQIGFDLDADSHLDQLLAAVAGPAGSTYLVGLANVPANPLFPDLGATAIAIVRLTHAGKPDLAYGKNGRVAHIDPAFAHLVMLDAALAPDGRLVTAGYVSDGDVRMAACRFEPDGAIDTGFGTPDTPGCAVLALPGGFHLANAVLPLPDGRVLLGGEDSAGRAVVAALDADGAIDPAFGDGGVRVLADGAAFDLARIDTRIVAVGQQDGAGAHGFIAQFDAIEGAPDVTFGGGFVGFDLGAPGGGDDALVSVSIAPDGSRVVAGWSEDGGQGRALLVRFDDAGARVAAFGVAGVREFDAPDGVDRRWLDAVDASDSSHLFVAGRDVTVLEGHPYTDVIVRRLHADGSDDANFGNAGTATAAFDLAAHASDTALVRHGARPLVAATVGASPLPPLTGDYAAARFDHGLQARFAVRPYWSDGGMLKPSSPVTVGHSNVTAFHVVPLPGFVLAGIEGCGGALSGAVYTTGPVVADCKVVASFEPAP